MKLTQFFPSFLLIYSLIINFTITTTQKAIINVPITDLIGQPIQIIRPNASPEASYNSIALCGGQTNSPYSCPRLHQALYNDIVEVIKTTKDEAYIRIAQSYYLIPSSSAPQSHYWTLKKNITLLDQLTQHNVSLDHLPNPIDFSDTTHLALKNSAVITLIEPHYDKTMNLAFSVGTRFVCVSSPHKKRNSSIEVFAIDYKTIKEHRIKIPSKKCILNNPTHSSITYIENYVNLLKKWSHTKHGCIPYTWGGTSFAHTTQGNFKEVMHKTDNGDYSSYEYDKDTQSPKSGFDCSGAIIRAAQICGIPYFCKNTTTIAQCLTTLKENEPLSSGDLILIKGHVMVVSDINKNLLIEARSYGHGYGKLHEIPINQVFEGIENYKDLTDAYFKKSVVKRKDKQGTIRDTFANLQLFSMASVWK